MAHASLFSSNTLLSFSIYEYSSHTNILHTREKKALYDVSKGIKHIYLNGCTKKYVFLFISMKNRVTMSEEYLEF